MPRRRSKLVGFADAAGIVVDGDHVALGGIWSHNAPSALVRELVRRAAVDLTLSAAPASGFAVDLLIAGGCVSRAYLPNVTFEHLGLAPAFRRAVESGELDLVECDEAGLVAGYRAAAAGLPFQPIVSIAGTALAEASPALVPAERGGVAVLEAPPLAPDVVLLHAQEGDVHGNVRHVGSVFADRVMAKAARRAVVVSVDRLVDNEEIRRDPQGDDDPGLPRHARGRGALRRAPVLEPRPLRGRRGAHPRLCRGGPRGLGRLPRPLPGRPLRLPRGLRAAGAAPL